jgi:hypothetical protein
MVVLCNVLVIHLVIKILALNGDMFLRTVFVGFRSCFFSCMIDVWNVQ